MFRGRTNIREAQKTPSAQRPRSSAIIRAEIQERFGFVPPFFDPALGIPEVLDNLWQQTLSAYVNNPLPAPFKEKLFAYLSWFCPVPYAIVSHSCALRPLGMRAEEIIELLEREPPIAEAPLAPELETLLRASGPLESWPGAGSPLEDALLHSAMLLYLEPERSQGAAAELRRVLGPVNHVHLVALLSYVRTCLAWVEAHPELSYEADQRVAANLAPLVAAQPRLADFFRTYPERVQREREAREQRVNEQATAVPRDQKDSEERFRKVFDDAPIGMALVGHDLTLLRVNDALCGTLGYESAELLGQGLAAITHLEDAHAAAAQQLFEGQNSALERRAIRLIKKGGELREAALSMTVIRDTDGIPLYALGVIEEIVNRDAVEEALRETREHLATSTAELDRRDRQIDLLGEAGDLLEACVSAEEIHSVVTKFGRELFPAESGSLYVLDDSHHVAASVASWGSASGSAEVFAPDDCWALRRGRLHAVRDPQAGLTCAHLKIVPSGGYVCAPLLAAGGALGVLHLRDDVASPAEPTQRMAAAFAEEVALALSNFRLRETLRTQAMRDPLTGLFNRRYLEEIVEREIQRARRHQRRLAIVMADIDYFKRFNDTYGREAGDEVLRTLGMFLQAHVRSEDWACRYDGAEFAVLMPESSAEGAQLWAERLREQVKRMEVRHWGRLLPSIALSLGVAANDDQKLNGRDILRLADEALQRAKANGRDQVSVATSA